MPEQCRKCELTMDGWFTTIDHHKLVYDNMNLVGGFKMFQTSMLFFHNRWDNPSQLTFIFFKMVETTNQIVDGFSQ